jgi:hypothetical protein
MLVPLIDGMTTRNIARCFTTTQALKFFENLYLQTPNSSISNPNGPQHSLWSSMMTKLTDGRIFYMILFRLGLIPNKSVMWNMQESMVLLHCHGGKMSLLIDQMDGICLRA